MLCRMEESSQINEAGKCSAAAFARTVPDTTIDENVNCTLTTYVRLQRNRSNGQNNATALVCTVRLDLY